MKNEQNITGSNTLTEDTPAPAWRTHRARAAAEQTQRCIRRRRIYGQALL